MDQEFVMKQLDNLSSSMTVVLVEQGKLYTMLEQVISNGDGAKTSSDNQALVLGDHGTRLTKIEGVVRILIWLSGIIGAVLTGVTISVINGLLGG